MQVKDLVGNFREIHTLGFTDFSGDMVTKSVPLGHIILNIMIVEENLGECAKMCAFKEKRVY